MVLATSVIALLPMVATVARAADKVACSFQAGLAMAALKFHSGGKMFWEVQVPKGGQTIVHIPKGPFELEAQLFDDQKKHIQTLKRPLDTATCSRFPIDVTMPEGG
jgi:hypothetical protein